MDVLDSLSGPEYDEPEVAEEGTVIPEEAQHQSEPELIQEPEQPPELPETKPFRIRAEWVMAIVAAFAAVLVGVIFLLSRPYLSVDEDPQSLQQWHEDIHATEAHRETVPDATVPETEPLNPTIPPKKNPYDRYDFQYNKNNYLVLQNVESYPGVDVSAYQGDIDWQQVKASGIDFAIIRLGYRGYESGKLVEDEYIQQNLERTKEVGMPIGAYFFSQALTIKEVDEEIDFMLKVLGDYELHMPIVLDWEIPTADARTAQMDARTLTALQEYFCKTMVEKGFTPMVYFNWHQSNTLLYLNELEAYPFWLALYTNRMTYPYHVEMWQYTASGRVPGIPGDVDINVYMPKQ